MGLYAGLLDYPVSGAPAALRSLEERLGLTFRSPSLLTQALTHRSYLNEHPEGPSPSNERLEFLGDALLNFIVADHLYRRFPEVAEGPLTDLRAALVRRETLAAWSQELALGDLLAMSRGEAMAGGRERPRNLASALEALLGALFLDRGLASVQGLVQRQVDAILQSRPWQELLGNAKSLLQERIQAEHHTTPRYRLLAQEGASHARSYTVEVLVEELALAVGRGPSRRKAEVAAAQAALEHLGR